MRHLTNSNIDRAYSRDGHLSITTPSCGCCSEYYSNDPEGVSSDWDIPMDELIQYVEREEQRLERIKDFIADNNNLTTITYINED